MIESNSIGKHKINARKLPQDNYYYNRDKLQVDRYERYIEDRPNTILFRVGFEGYGLVRFAIVGLGSSSGE